MDIGPPMYEDWKLYKCKLHTFSPIPILQFALEMTLILCPILVPFYICIQIQNPKFLWLDTPKDKLPHNF